MASAETAGLRWLQMVTLDTIQTRLESLGGLLMAMKNPTLTRQSNSAPSPGSPGSAEGVELGFLLP